MNETLNLRNFYYENSEEEYWSPFPNASILINPNNDKMLRDFLGSQGTGAVAVTKEGNCIFFNDPECADNYEQLDFTQGRFTIWDFRLGGRFEEKLTVSSKEELISIDQAITAIVDKYPCLRPPRAIRGNYTWVQFYQLAEKIFDDPDWAIKYSNPLHTFLSFEDASHYENIKPLIGLLEADQQDLKAINQAIVELMKNVETPNDDIKIITVKDRIEHIELLDRGRYIIRYTTTRALKAGIISTELPLCCLRQEPNGDRIQRELNSSKDKHLTALDK